MALRQQRLRLLAQLHGTMAGRHRTNKFAFDVNSCDLQIASDVGARIKC